MTVFIEILEQFSPTYHKWASISHTHRKNFIPSNIYHFTQEHDQTIFYHKIKTHDFKIHCPNNTRFFIHSLHPNDLTTLFQWLKISPSLHKQWQETAEKNPTQRYLLLGTQHGSLHLYEKPHATPLLKHNPYPEWERSFCHFSYSENMFEAHNDTMTFSATKNYDQYQIKAQHNNNNTLKGQKQSPLQTISLKKEYQIFSPSILLNSVKDQSKDSVRIDHIKKNIKNNPHLTKHEKINTLKYTSHLQKAYGFWTKRFFILRLIVFNRLIPRTTKQCPFHSNILLAHLLPLYLEPEHFFTMLNEIPYNEQQKFLFDTSQDMSILLEQEYNSLITKP